MRSLPVAIITVSGLALGAPPSAAVAPPAEGPGCTYLQPQVKQCAVSPVGGVATFDAILLPPTGLVVTFDEPVTGMQPPPPGSFRASFSGKTATVVPLRRDPLPGSTVHFDTASVHVTLNLKIGPKPDTQIVILDPRQALLPLRPGREDEKEVAEVEALVARRVDDFLASAVAEGEITLTDPDAGPTRHNQVVLRALKVVRLGERRVLLFSIDNRTSDELEVRAIRAWVDADGGEREILRPAFHMARSTIPVAEEVRGAVTVMLKPGRVGRARIRIECTDPERVVELGGIRLR